MKKNALIELVVLLSISVTLTACGTTKYVRKSPEVLTERVEYRVGPDDVVSITVWRHPDFSLDVEVDSRGIIRYPLLGDLKVAGMTTYQLADLIVEKSARYIKEPQVRVEVKEFNSQYVMIIGEVKTPGIYYFKTGKMTLLRAISIAGSFTEDAIYSNVKVARGDPDNPEVLTVNLSSVIFKNERWNDIVLHSGDIVYVPKTLIANINKAIRDITPALTTYLLTKAVTD